MRGCCDHCGRADKRLRRLMVVTDTGVSWTWQFCTPCYELVLPRVRAATDLQAARGGAKLERAKSETT